MEKVETSNEHDDDQQRLSQSGTTAPVPVAAPPHARDNSQSQQQQARSRSSPPPPPPAPMTSSDSESQRPSNDSINNSDSSISSNNNNHSTGGGGSHVWDSAWWFVKDQWFLLAMATLIAISSQYQVPPSGQQMRQTVVTYLCVSLIFLVTGCVLPTRVLVENYSRWKVHLFIQVQCFLLTSATVFGVVSAAASSRDFLDPGLIVGFVFLGCVPTTLSSNVVMTGQAHGNTALTVVQTTIGNFLGPLVSPLLITMYTSTGAWYDSFLPEDSGGFGEVYRRVFMQLGLSVYVPMVCGQVIQNLFPKATRKVLIEWKLKKLNSFALLCIIWQTFDQAFATGAFTSVKTSNIIFMVFISIALYLIWLSICFLGSIPWLPKQDTIAVCYCVPAKTPAIGVPLSNVMYVGLTPLQNSKIQLPMVIFQGLQIVISSMLTIAFRRWIRPDEERDAMELKNNGTFSSRGVESA